MVQWFFNPTPPPPKKRKSTEQRNYKYKFESGQEIYVAQTESEHNIVTWLQMFKIES